MKCAECGHSNPDKATQCEKCREPFDDTGEPGVRRAPSGDVDDSSLTGVRPTPSPSAVSSSGTYAGTGATGAIPTYNSFGDRYEILELLGEGGMGRVYKAWDRDLEKVIALKTIRGEHASNPEVLKRFKQELLLARKITHKNVIRIHDMGEAGGVRFFTMEYIPGDSLKERIEKLGKIPAQQAVPMAKQILGALEEAHEQGVVHRDLKPQNIMIDQEGMLHIMDFGIARSAQDTSGLTATGTIMGTPDYMSPEQVKGEKADGQADLFSFGVILYEMLTGTLPYQADTTAAKVMMRLSKKPTAPREIHEQIPKYLESIVLKCLEVDRELRYRNAREVLEDIEREQVDRSPIARLQRTLVRRKGTVAAAAVLAAAIGTAAYFAAKAGAPPPVIEEPTTLAVVPFNNASGDPSLDWLGPSLAEILITELGQSSHLRTVSSDRVHQILNDLRIPLGAKLEPATITRLAEFSSAETIVSGQFLKLGDQIRIDATLQDLEEASTIPLKVEAANENELLAAIATLAQSVQENLGLSRDIVAELQAKRLRPSSESIQALRLYNEGLQLARQGSHLEALKRFEASTSEDPNFALAYSELAQTYAELGYSEEAQRFSRRSVELSQKLPPQERYLVLAVQARILQDHEKAIESYQNLIEVLPDDRDVHYRLALLYEETGGFEQAADHISRVLDHDPNRLDALFTIGRIEIAQGNPDGALEHLNKALSLAIRLDNEEARGTVLYLMGLAFEDLDRLDDALQYYQDSLALRRSAGDKGGSAVTLKQLASVQQIMGSSDDALDGYQEALTLQQEIGDESGTGRTLIDLGNLFADRGDVENALDVLKQALRIQRETGDESHEAICLNNIGVVYLDGGQYEEALTYLELAQSVRDNLGNPIELAETLHNIGEASLKMGRYEKALASYLRSLELSRTAGDKEGAAIESFSMGTVFEYQGRYGAGLEAREEALGIFRELRQKGFWLAEILRGHGQAMGLVGRFDEAETSLEEALALARELENQSFIAQALTAQGDVSLYRGDFGPARRLYQEAIEEASKTTDRSLPIPAKLGLAKLDLREGRAEAALASLPALAEQSAAVGLGYVSTNAEIHLAEALLESGELPRAQEMLEATLRESERFGLQLLLARSHNLLGRLHRLRETETEAERHYGEALRILNEMREESGADALLERADLDPIYTESTRWAAGTES